MKTNNHFYFAEQQRTPNYDKIISHLKHLKGNVSLHPWVCDKLSVKAFRPSYIIYLAAWAPEGRKGQSQRKGPVAEGHVDPSYNQNPDESHWLLELSHEFKEGNLAIPITTTFTIYIWSTITIWNTVTRFLNSSKFSPGILSKRHRNNNQRTFAIHPQSWRSSSRSRVSTWKTVISSLNSSMVRPWLLSSM